MRIIVRLFGLIALLGFSALSPSVAQSLSPIYRFYNQSSGSHFLTISSGEKDSIIESLPQYRFEGPVFFASQSAGQGLSPVFRFFNTQNGSHFYTISASERDTIIASLPQFRYEGPAWYARTAPGQDSTALYRFYRNSAGSHFYTAIEAERDQVVNTLADFRYEGPAYYVWMVGTTVNSGGASTQHPPPQMTGGPFVSFAPLPLSTTIKEGEPGRLSLVATLARPIPEPLTVLVVDNDGILSKGSNIQPIPGTNLSQYRGELDVPKTLRPGTHAGTITLKLCLDATLTCERPYEGSPWTIPYSVTVNPWQAPRSVHKLTASEVGVAFTRTPDWSRLTRTISVVDNFGAKTSWTAESNQTWLSVTPSGTTEVGRSGLTLQADPASLPVDQISYATVTITSLDPGVSSTDTVEVALWKGTSNFPASAQAGSAGPSFAELASDPLRPVVYVHRASGHIEALNVYTAQTVNSFSLPDATLGKMVVAADGSALFVANAATGGIEQIDLRSPTNARKSWPKQGTRPLSTVQQLLYARPNGVGVVMANNGAIFRASDGSLLTEDGGKAPAAVPYSSAVGYPIAVAPDSTRVFSVVGAYPPTPGYWNIDYSEINGGTMSVGATTMSTQTFPDIRVAHNILGLSTSKDGRHFYIAEQGCSVWNASDAARVSSLTPNSGSAMDLIVDVDGRVFCTVDSSLKIFGPGEVLMRTIPMSLVLPSMFGTKVLSADSFVAASLQASMAGTSVEYRMVFIPVGP